MKSPLVMESDVVVTMREDQMNVDSPLLANESTAFKDSDAYLIDPSESRQLQQRPSSHHLFQDAREVPWVRWIVPLTVFLVGQSMVIFMYSLALQDDKEGVTNSMDNIFKDYVSVMKQDVQGYLNDLNSMKVLFEISDGVQSPQPLCNETTMNVSDCTVFNNFLHPERFSVFTAKMIERKTGIQAMSWIPIVNHHEREDYEKVGSAYYGGDYVFHDVKGEVDIDRLDHPYILVFFIEPVEGNTRAILLNLASNPTRLEALQKANYTHRQVITGRLTLAQEVGTQSGFLAIDPLHINNVLHGYGTAVFRIGDMVVGAVNQLAPEDIRLIVRDQTDPETGEAGLWLHSMHLDPETSRWVIETEEDFDEAFIQETLDDHPETFQETIVTVADHHWVVMAYPLEEFISKRMTQEPMVVIVVGTMVIVITSLMFVFVLINMTADRRREKQRGLDEISREKTRRKFMIEKRIREEKQAQLEKEKLFIAFTFHELRNPLNGVLGGLEYMDALVTNILEVLILINDMSKDEVSDDINSGEIQGQKEKAASQLELCVTSAKTLQNELSEVIESNDHVVDILDHVLDLSKLEAGKLILDSKAMNLAMVANSSVSAVRRVSGAKVGLLVQCVEPFWVRGSARHVKQVIINLLGNAVKYCPSGFVKVEIEEISSNCKCKDQHTAVHIRVKDTGIGITPEQKGKLFHKYVQGGFGSVGTGLGLVISQSLVQLHQQACPAHGVSGINILSPLPVDDQYRNDMLLIAEQQKAAAEQAELAADLPVAPSYAAFKAGAKGGDVGLDADSGRALGPGSMIHFTIPIRIAGKGKLSALKAVDKRRSISKVISRSTSRRLNVSKTSNVKSLPKNVRVLVVDDEPPNRKIFIRKFTAMSLFKPLNWTVDIAENGEKALEMVRQNNHCYKVITMDQNMSRAGGRISGSQTSALIRKMESDATVGIRALIICATGNCTAGDLVEHRQSGMDLTWAKPFPKPPQMYQDILSLSQTHGWPTLSGPELETSSRPPESSTLLESFRQNVEQEDSMTERSLREIMPSGTVDLLKKTQQLKSLP
eukprot:209957_1